MENVNLSLFRSIVDVSQDGIFITDIQSGKIIFVNQRVCDRLGRTANELQGKYIYEIPGSGYSHENLERLVAEVMEKGEWQMETSYTNSEQQHIPLEVTIKHLADGDAHYLVSFVRNIVDRKNKENILNYSRNFYNTITATSLEGIIICDSKGYISYINPSFSNMVGYNKEEMLSHDLMEMIYPEDAGNVMPRLRAVMDKEQLAVNAEFRIRHKNNSWCTVEACAMNLSDDPLVNGILMSFKDITLKRRAQKSAASQRNYLLKLINALPHPVWSKDWHGNYTLANEAFGEMLGVDPAGVIGQTDFDFYPEPTAEAHVEEDRLTLITYTATPSSKYKSLDKDTHQTRWYLVKKIPVIVEEHSEVLGIAIDVTELEDARSQLQEQRDYLEKLYHQLDRFLYSTSHEMRAPITSLKGLLRLYNTETNENMLHEYISRIHACVGRQEEILNNLISYSYNENNDSGNTEKIDFPYMVKHVLEELKIEGRKPALEIHQQFATDKPFYCDRERIRIILYNLLQNATQYQRPDESEPCVNIMIATNTNGVLISIEDNGEGIRKDCLEKVFNMFFRCSENSKGSGLGLFVVKETVQKLQGTISVSSRLGKGSHFSIYLPQQHAIRKSVNLTNGEVEVPEV